MASVILFYGGYHRSVLLSAAVPAFRCKSAALLCRACGLFAAIGQPLGLSGLHICILKYITANNANTGVSVFYQTVLGTIKMKEIIPIDTLLEEKIKKELENSFHSKRKRIFSKIFSAALGSVPWVGGFLSAMADFKSEEGQVKNNELYTEWLKEHSEKMKLLGETLLEVVKKFEEFNDDINERLESEEYLQIIRKAFRAWDNADTFEKRDLIRTLLTNSGTQSIVPDDLIRLFLDWLNLYHEIHFSVIKTIYQSPGLTRYQIWQELNGQKVRENSMEADLFKLLIRDLSMGGVIRQYRRTDYCGNFVKKRPTKRLTSSNIYKSAFDNEEEYELTELGKQFVHYTMNDVVRKIE